MRDADLLANAGVVVRADIGLVTHASHSLPTGLEFCVTRASDGQTSHPAGGCPSDGGVGSLGAGAVAPRGAALDAVLAVSDVDVRLVGAGMDVAAAHAGVRP